MSLLGGCLYLVLFQSGCDGLREHILANIVRAGREEKSVHYLTHGVFAVAQVLRKPHLV